MRAKHEFNGFFSMCYASCMSNEREFFILNLKEETVRFLKKFVLRKCFLLFLYQCKFYSKKTLLGKKTCFLYGEETMMRVEKLFFLG